MASGPYLLSEEMDIFYSQFDTYVSASLRLSLSHREIYRYVIQFALKVKYKYSFKTGIERIIK